MSHEREPTEYSSDPGMSEIRRLMDNYGSNQMISKFQTEMWRYSGSAGLEEQNIDENGNIEMHNNNSYVASASRKRVRKEPIIGANDEKKLRKCAKK